MNWDRLKGNLKQIKGKAKRRWGKATNDNRMIAAGHRDQLSGKIQEGYGVGKDKVEKTIDKLTD
jgi:uncharacterized protein YjbJ (UPF0337 family)